MSEESRLEYLKRFITECDHAYHVKGESLVPDAQYDNLKRELIRLEEGSEIDEFSPSQRVGGAIESGIPHTHQFPLLSMENAFTHDEVMKDIGRMEKNLDPQEYLLEHKLDGLTGCLTYDGGEIKVTATRGDGEIGESLDSSQMNIPRTVKDTAALDIIGEFVLPYEILNYLNADLESRGKEPYMSPRNAAVGLIRKDPSLLTFIAFSARYHDGSRFADTEIELLDKIRSFGFTVVDHSQALSATDLVPALDAWPKSDEFDCDGTVVKLNDISVQEDLGNRRNSPRWALAYKKNSAGTGTVLRDVVWQVGCHGFVTPVGLIDPVLVSKSIISRANLHNPLQIMHMGLKINGGVKVIRSGEVIPMIIGTDPALDENTKPVPIPAICPSCSTKLRPSGPELNCPNTVCPDRVISQLIRIASRDGLDIGGLGDKTASQLVERGLVKVPSDLFKLTEDAMLEAGFKPHTASKVINSLSDISVTLDKLYYAMCIPSISSGSAKVLAKAYPHITNLLHATPDGMISTTSLESHQIYDVYEYFNGSNIYDNWPITIIESETRLDNTLPLRTWVITGTLTSPRRVVEAKLNELNVEISNRVGANISMMVIGDKPTAHKVTRAQGMGIQIINETEMLQWIEANKG